MQFGRLVVAVSLVSWLVGAGCKKDRESLSSPAPDHDAAEDAASETNVTDEGEIVPSDAYRSASRGLDARHLDPQLVRELQTRVGLIERPPPVVEGLLQRSDIRQITHYKGTITDVAVPGREVSSEYNATRLALGSELGCAVQRWSFLHRQELEKYYESYVGTLVNGSPEARIDAASVHSVFAGVRMLVLKHLPSETMVQVSCSESLVSSDQLRELASRVLARL